MTKQGILTAALVGLAGIQGVVLASSLARPQPTPAPVRFVAVGDTISVLSGEDEVGMAAHEQIENDADRWTAILAFASTCSYTDKAAPEWTAWLQKPHRFSVVAITRDSAGAGPAYAQRQGWGVRVVTRENPPKGSTMGMLSTRTPWVFLIDPKGVVRFEGHGQRIAALDSVARALAVGSEVGAHRATMAATVQVER